MPDIYPLPTWEQVKADPKQFGPMVANNLDQKVIESYNRMGQWNALQNAVDNFALYLNGRREGGRTYRFRMNLIQGVNIANAAIQVGDQPKVELLPRESGEKPLCFINTNVAMPPARNTEKSKMAMLFSGLRPGTYDPAAPGFLAPLNDAETVLVKQAQAQSDVLRLQAMARNEPEPIDLLPKDFYIELNDSTLAAATQTLLDVKLEEGGFTQALVENQLYTGIFGWQFLMPEFDAETQTLIFTNPYFSTVHMDPLKTDMKRAQSVVYDEYLDVDEAKMLYPDLSRPIDQYSNMGPPQQPGTIQSVTLMPWLQPMMGRKVVIIRNAWIRNQEFPVGPMTAEDAVLKGLVIEGEVPDESLREDVGGIPEAGIAGADGADGLQPKASNDGGSPDAASLPGSGAQPGVDVAPPAMRPAYFHPVTQEELTPDHPEWPKATRRALREIRVIANQLVYDRESKRVDIPMGHNVNIPIPYTPYGQGEPERLEPLQRAYNATLTDIVEHGDSVAFAPKLVSRQLAMDNPELLRVGLSDPRKFYPVDDKILAMGVDKIMGSYTPPALPTDTWKREQTLFEKFQYESDQSAVTRGQTPGGGDMSGNAITALQSAAKTSVDFKGMRLKNMVTHIVKVVLGDLMEYMTPEDCARVVRKYPKEVWAYIHPQVKKIQYDIAIKIGKQNNQAQTVVNAANTAMGGQTISPQSFLQAIDLDPETEQNNRIKWAQQQGAMEQGMQPQQPEGVESANGSQAPQPSQSTSE